MHRLSETSLFENNIYIKIKYAHIFHLYNLRSIEFKLRSRIKFTGASVWAL